MPTAHQVQNRFFNDSSTGYSIRMGDYKLIVGNPGDSRVIAWPDLHPDNPTHFGADGGVREPDTNHCRAHSGPHDKQKRPCRPSCLFDVVRDISESNDLCPKGVCADPEHSRLHALLMKRLAEAGATGPSTSLAYRFNSTAFKAASALVCANAKVTNFIEPSDLKV